MGSEKNIAGTKEGFLESLVEFLEFSLQMKYIECPERKESDPEYRDRVLMGARYDKCIKDVKEFIETKKQKKYKCTQCGNVSLLINNEMIGLCNCKHVVEELK